MGVIFEIIDKSGRRVHLSEERWTHINQEHPEVAPYLEQLEETLKNPIKVSTNDFDETVKYHYTYLKERKSAARYLLVIVKYLNGKGFIITAYFVRSMP